MQLIYLKKYRHFHILNLLVFILIVTSCKEKKTDYSYDEQNVIDCLEGYNFDCGDILYGMEDGDGKTFLDGFWNYRCRNYRIADSLFETINESIFDLPFSSRIFQDYTLVKSRNEFMLGKFDFDFENKILQKEKFTQFDLQNFKIKILLEKSSKLRELNKIKYSFVTIMYSLFLKESNDIKVKGRYQPEYFIAVNFWRENQIDLTVFFIKKAFKNCNDFENPDCRKIECMVRILLNDNINIEKHLINNKQYAPEIHDFIKLMLSSDRSEKDTTINSLTSKVEDGRDNCIKYFYNILYLIDDYLYTHDLQNAKKNILLLESCEAVECDYLFSFRKQQFAWIKYEEFCSVFDLRKSYVAAIKTRKDAEYYFGISNIHSADFVFLNNSFLIESILNLYLMDTISKQIMINEFINSKSLIQKISNTSSIFHNKKVPQSTITKYATLQNKIDFLEKDVNEYRDTIFKDLSIYEKLYFLYEEQYAIEQSIKDVPTISEEQEEMSFDSLSQFLEKTNTQAIDILATEDNYFFSFIRPDTIIIEKYEKEFVEAMIDSSILDIKNKTQIGNHNFSNQRLFSLIQPYLDTAYRNIIFIPDQKFTEFPFEQLVISSVHDTSTTYLGEYYNISYTYNINQIIPKSDDDQYINQDCALFSYSSTTTLADRAEKEIPELPLALQEIDDISKVYKKSKTYSGEYISKQSIFNSLDASILHISSHSNSNPENLLDNYFYVRDKNGKPDKMYGFEIKNHKLDKNLVILSSCNSGTGAYKPGAGTFSISRDFIMSGAQTVIKSLWAVNEASTAELMVYFHQFFKQGYTAGMALTLAKRELIYSDKFSHTYYWAGFELEGNPRLRLTIVR